MTPAITRTIQNLANHGPIVQVTLLLPKALEEALSEAEKKSFNPIKVTAMIDTGASKTVIRQDIIERIKFFKPKGIQSVSTPSSKEHRCNTYHVRLTFEPGVAAELTIMALPMEGQNIQALIGRDLLQHGIFIYTGYANNFTLAF